MDQRNAARKAQRAVDVRRLCAHRQLGIELLRLPACELRRRLVLAGQEVDRWEAMQLCSVDYIERWRAWLALPVEELARRMCSDAQGWGDAMRQNSPFTAGRGS